jgi:hypothetical protein
MQLTRRSSDYREIDWEQLRLVNYYRLIDFAGQVQPGSFSFRMGVAYRGGKEHKGFVPHGVLLARHAPHEPKPFAQRSPHDITALSVT